MALNPQLVRTIKVNFAVKSTAQLEEIARDYTDETWSMEAVAAANELLQERRAGRAKEPPTPEPEQHLPQFGDDVSAVALGMMGTLLTGMFTGYLVIPVYRNSEVQLPPDLPQPFGPRLAWLALDTTDTNAVADAIGLRGARETTWANGVEEAYKSRVFVTPPLGDWTLVASTSLLPMENMATFVKPLLERLSGRFRDAQYFCTQSDLQVHGWARARAGKLLRGRGWFGREKQILWDEGAPTRGERLLELAAADPDEDAVKALASLWSVDPTTIDREFKEPLPGRLGRVTWSKPPGGN